MQYEWPSETKRLRRELGDPLLKVVYDAFCDEFHVLKLIPGGYDYIYPIYLFGELGTLAYPTYYWHLNFRFKEWDGRVYPAIRGARYDYKDVKTRIYEDRRKGEQRKADWDKKIEEIGMEAGDYAYHKLGKRSMMSLPPAASQILAAKGLFKGGPGNDSKNLSKHLRTGVFPLR